jgi:hypothetical protein
MHRQTSRPSERFMGTPVRISSVFLSKGGHRTSEHRSVGSGCDGSNIDGIQEVHHGTHGIYGKEGVRTGPRIGRIFTNEEG